MGSIYGSGRNTTNNKSNKTYENKQKDTFVQKNNSHKDLKKIFLTSAVVNAITAAVLIIFSFAALSPDNVREVYTKFVLLPIAAFVGAFISVLLNKDFLMNLAGNAAVLFLVFLIFIDFSFAVILWLLFYAVSAVIGTMTAYIAKTFR